MKKLLSICLFVYLFIGVFLPQTYAQTTQPKETYIQGRVVTIVKEVTTIGDGGNETLTQTLQVRLSNNSIITLDQSTDTKIASLKKYIVGQDVVLDRTLTPDGAIHYVITDTYRLPTLLFFAVVFVLFTFLISGRKGIGALGGLIISLLVILFYLVPSILYYQQDPLTVSLIASGIILIVTTFLAHGFSKQTAIAVASTFLALLATYCIAILAVNIAHIAGLGTEDSYLLELSPRLSINPQGLLLGGIIIGTLGALNDITTTQVAAVFALFKANKEQTFFHLLQHGLNIGKEHIASLINTLVLAYAGTSLPIFIFLIMNPQHLPYWVIINNEQFAEEIVRTLAGSMGLMLAVPIVTVLAAYLAPKLVASSK